MSFAQFSPTWFYGYDVALELVFACIALVIALFAFKVFRETDQKQIRLFGIAFSLISVSYFIQSLFNYMVMSKTNKNVCNAMQLNSISLFNDLGIYTHMVLMTLGLIVLTYMSLRIENKRAMVILVAVSLLGIFLSRNSVYLFFLISTVYLFFLTLHFIENYIKNRQGKSLLVAIGFLCLLFGSAHFLVAMNHQVYYVIGQILELIAYLLFLWNLLLVQKR